MLEKTTTVFNFQREMVALCAYPGYTFDVLVDGRGATYLQGEYLDADTETGFLSVQKTRRWFLSPEMTRSEIVQTVFKCVMTSMEHRVREWFRYDKQPVFCPHFEVDALHALCVQKKFARRK